MSFAFAIHHGFRTCCPTSISLRSSVALSNFMSLGRSTIPRNPIASSRKFYSAKSDIFADSKSAEFVAAAGSISSIPKLHGLPEVIVIGRANCGKSTLFNSVLGRKSLLHTSKKAGRTRELNFFRVGKEPGRLILVDAPGYGARGRPEWGEMFDTYIKTRKELKCVYILFNSKHPVNQFDTQMLAHLQNELIPRDIGKPTASDGAQPQLPTKERPKFTLQSVITKADCIPTDKVAEVIGRMRREIREAAPLCLSPIVTGAGMSPPFGIEEMRRNIGEVCGLL